MKTVAWLDSFVNSLLERTGCRPAQGSTIRTLLRGIATTGSVVLSEVLRPQVEKEDLRTIQIEAGNGKGDHLPLSQEVFSTQDPAYQALGEGAWTATYQRAIERVLAHIGPEGIWLMDRGFDDVFWLRWMHANVEQSVIRVKSNRSVHPGTTQEKAINIGQLAETLDACHTTQIRYVNKSNHVEKF